MRRMKAMGVQDLSLSSNGLLFAPMAKELKAAGLDRVNFSLDTLRPDRFQRIARLYGTRAHLDAVDAAPDRHGAGEAEHGGHPRLERRRDNRHGPAYHRQAHSHALYRGHALLRGARVVAWDNLVPAAEIRQRLLDEWEEMEPLRDGVKGNGPAKYWQIPGAKGTVGLISAVTECFCGDCNRIRLSADGKINPCLGHVHEVDLKPVLRDAGHSLDDLVSVVADAILKKPRNITSTIQTATSSCAS